MKHPLVVRSMRTKDAAAVTRMMKGLQAFHEDVSVTTAKHFLTYCLGTKALSKTWIACHGRAPVGFAVTHDWMNFVRAKPMRTMTLLYVEEKFRGLGVGQALVLALIKDAVAKGFLRLDTSAAKHNRQANDFYKKLGFQKRKAYSHHYAIEGAALLQLTKYKI
jgi:ribosomal protein S18 acetylase RimI-like enzyme